MDKKRCQSIKFQRVSSLCHGIIDASSKRFKEQIDFLQTIIDAIPSPVFYKDKDGIYRGCNKAFEAYIGLNLEQIVGKSVFDIAPKELANKYYEMDNALLQQQGVQIYETRVAYADGIEHDVLFNKATFLDEKNKVAGLVGVLTDISERKKAELELKKSTDMLEVLLDQVVQTMATIAETRDMYTAGHQKRVSELGVLIAKELNLSPDEIKSVQVAGMLHDIGKISVPAEILTKPCKLTTHELAIVNEHVAVGYNILKNIAFPWPIADIVHQHHERCNGSGYPNGLRENEILIQAHILAVADVVEAMSSHRPYRPSLGIVKAITEISANRGILYKQEVVAACVSIFEKGLFAKSDENLCGEINRG